MCFIHYNKDSIPPLRSYGAKGPKGPRGDSGDSFTEYVGATDIPVVRKGL